MTDNARTDSNGNGGGVRYTTREMFDKIDHKLDGLSEKLDQKVDRNGPEHLHLVQGIADNTTKINELELKEEIRDALSAAYKETALKATDWRHWALPTGLTTVYTVLIILTTTHVI